MAVVGDAGMTRGVEAALEFADRFVEEHPEDPLGIEEIAAIHALAHVGPLFSVVNEHIALAKLPARGGPVCCSDDDLEVALDSCPVGTELVWWRFVR
eukprot:m.24200 g.24200  ORF g.24200 m.24200 type:complete len:97 (+) comp3983_c0_seq1:284-574(+)